MGGDGIPFPHPARAALRTGRRSTTARRVLIVDDDDAIRQLLTELLTEAGYVVDQARGGREGLERAAASPPDIILLDKLMADGDGTMFAETYASMTGRRAPIVAMCASRDGAQWSETIRAAAHVPKPFDIEDLLGIVARHARSGSPAGS